MYIDIDLISYLFRKSINLQYGIMNGSLYTL